MLEFDYDAALSGPDFKFPGEFMESDPVIPGQPRFEACGRHAFPQTLLRWLVSVWWPDGAFIDRPKIEYLSQGLAATAVIDGRATIVATWSDWRDRWEA